MVSQEIRTAATSLGALAGLVGVEEWALVSAARRVLFGAADHAEALEHNLLVPGLPQPTPVLALPAGQSEEVSDARH